tara:strand:- start:574 stop:813 length:240 start_codon:yes stop_codon:yes gene_type:complete
VLRAEILDENGKPRKIKGTRIVVYDEKTGNPLSLVVEFHEGAYYTSQVGDKDFNSLLESLGVNKTVLVDEIDLSPRIES